MMSGLTDSRLRALDDDNLDSATRAELLESLNSDLNFVRNTLRDMRVSNSNPFITSMVSRLSENQCGEDDNHFSRSRRVTSEENTHFTDSGLL